MLGGAYSLPLGGNWGLVARLGVGQVKARADFYFQTQHASTSERETELYAGVGATYAISSQIKLELGVDASQGQFAGQKGHVRLVSLGASFAF